VCLDGSESFDVQGDPFDYIWQWVAGEAIVLRAGASASESCFTAPNVLGSGVVQVALTVSNPSKGRTTDIINIEVVNDAVSLFANAGNDAVVGAGTKVTLNGSASRSSDGGEFSVSWTQLEGPVVTILDDESAVATFTAPFSTTDQVELVFLLTVSRGELTATDEVRVTVWQAASGVTEYAEDFDGLAIFSDPTDWVDTGPDNRLTVDDDQFMVLDSPNGPALGTTSTSTNIHSHYVATGVTAWTDYTYSGRMLVSESGGGVGVTFLSDYPNSDRYYRLRSFSDPNVPEGRYFHVYPHGTAITSGDSGTGTQPIAGTWYHFEIRLEVSDTETHILGKVWPDGSAKPSYWDIDCIDASSARLTSGTIGVWSMGPGAKYWDDLEVTNVVVDSRPSGCDDTDLDGVDDCEDGCPLDYEKTEPGECGCGVPDDDADNNGTADCLEQPAALVTSRTLLNFSVSANAVSFDLWNSGDGTISYTLSENANWLSLSSVSGSTSGERDTITASVNRNVLANGTYQAEITVTPSIGSTLTILASVLVQPASSGLTPIARWDVVPRQRIEVR
jgi:hypothetical protein